MTREETNGSFSRVLKHKLLVPKRGEVNLVQARSSGTSLTLRIGKRSHAKAKPWRLIWMRYLQLLLTYSNRATDKF